LSGLASHARYVASALSVLDSSIIIIRTHDLSMI
jgi:hypothetical protein